MTDGAGDTGRAVGTDWPALGGLYTTDRLVAAAGRLQALGWSPEQVRERVFRPFIVVGRAAWVDTWGAPRYGPGPIVRSHEGQDVFCDYGAQVLASEDGIVQFDVGLLGGRVARLYRPDGSYWYYAHLSDWNTVSFSSGDRVKAGDVIGYCGNTGDAVTTPPHVHFGWYRPDGEAIDPMLALIGWLHAAEGRAAAALAEAGASKDEVEGLLEATFARPIGLLEREDGPAAWALLYAQAATGTADGGPLAVGWSHQAPVWAWPLGLLPLLLWGIVGRPRRGAAGEAGGRGPESTVAWPLVLSPLLPWGTIERKPSPRRSRRPAPARAAMRPRRRPRVRGKGSDLLLPPSSRPPVGLSDIPRRLA